MLMYLLGRRHLSFQNNDGKAVEGDQLFVSYPKEGVEGEMTDKIFIRQGFALPPKMTPGDTLEIAFDNRGKPEKIAVVPSK